MPGAVAAHGMAGQIDAGRVVLQALAGNFQHLHGVHAAEVFPVEAIGPAVGRRDEVEPALRGIGGALTDAFHAGAVARQDQGRRRIAVRYRCRNAQSVILHAAVDLADEGDLPRLIGLLDIQFQRHAMAGLAAGPVQFKRPSDRVTFGRGFSLNAEADFANAQRRDGRYGGRTVRHTGGLERQE